MLRRLAAGVELGSLIVLLVNLATVHWEVLASLLGPIHGCAYLAVIGSTWVATRSRRTRLLSAVPGIGGLLALRATPEKPVKTPGKPVEQTARRD